MSGQTCQVFVDPAQDPEPTTQIAATRKLQIDFRQGQIGLGQGSLASETGTIFPHRSTRANTFQRWH